MNRRISITLSIVFAAAVGLAYSTSVDALSRGPQATGSAHVEFPEGLRELSFNAITQRDGTVKGHFTLFNRGSGLVVHGDVDCLRVDGNIATISGTIWSTNASIFDGRTGIFRVTDNGEGANDAPDKSSRLVVDTASIGWDCNTNLNFGQLADVSYGNVQVRP